MCHFWWHQTIQHPHTTFTPSVPSCRTQAVALMVPTDPNSNTHLRVMLTKTCYTTLHNHQGTFQAHLCNTVTQSHHNVHTGTKHCGGAQSEDGCAWQTLSSDWRAPSKKLWAVLLLLLCHSKNTWDHLRPLWKLSESQCSILWQLFQWIDAHL